MRGWMFQRLLIFAFSSRREPILRITHECGARLITAIGLDLSCMLRVVGIRALTCGGGVPRAGAAQAAHALVVVAPRVPRGVRAH